jgi:two-component system, NarL family, response regulator LiaR
MTAFSYKQNEQAAPEIKILIVDDHKIVREGIKAFLTPYEAFEIVGEAGNGLEAVKLASCLSPDIILMDLMMPEMDGVEATQQIKQKYPQTKILILTSFAEDEKVVAAIKAGATGYLMKDSSPSELKAAILEIHHGESYLPPHIASLLIKELNRPGIGQTIHSLLTEREEEIIKLVARGCSNQEIAQELVLSVWTVRTHISSILTKLNLKNRTQAALFALREGMVELTQ